MHHMSTSPLKHTSLAPPTGNERERLEQFARAMALRDRSRNRAWMPDADVERAIRGYAYAAAIAEHRVLQFNGDEIDAAIVAYRRARRLPARREPSQRALLAFTDGR
jgi:hypothetical protein